MKTEIIINVRVFPVLAWDHRTGNEEAIEIPVTKEMLQAAALTGQSADELIERICDRRGYSALEIGKPDKHSIPVDLGELVRCYEEHKDHKGTWSWKDLEEV